MKEDRTQRDIDDLKRILVIQTAFLGDLIARTEGHDHIEVLLGHNVTGHKGYVGNFQTTVQEVSGPRQRLIEHGVVVMAIGAEEYGGTAYGLGTHPRIMSQGDLEERIADGDLDAGDALCDWLVDDGPARIPAAAERGARRAVKAEVYG